MKKHLNLPITIPVFLMVFFFSLLLLYFNTHHENFENNPAERPNDWFFRQRAYPSGRMNHQAYLRALKQRKEMLSAVRGQSKGQWEFAGPVNIGGRITDVEMDPTDLSVVYIGAASGGVFKSTDQGTTWFPVFDTASSLSIGDIALAPSDPNIIYVGTGESNAGGGSLAYDGVGIYKSVDAGESWEYAGLEESGSIGRIVINSNNSDIAYAATMGSLFANTPERGVYKTTDGGESWENVLFISDSTGAIDLAIHPDHPDTVYAAMWERIRRPNRRSYGGPTCGIYRSYDGGESWVELTNGLPSAASQKGRIGLDISISNPNILYAVYADQTGYFNGVYKSTDNGNSWSRTNDGSLSNAFVSYGWWFGRIKVNPVNPDNVFVIGFDIYRTQNGGSSWTDQSGYNVHVDQHAVYIHPLDDSFVLLGNDGGLYRSSNGGNSWIWNQNLPITQFYTCALDYQYPERLYGGAQDNGTNRTMTGNLDDWTMIYGGDGFNVLVDPLNNSYVYAEYQYGNLARSTDGGYNFYNATSGISGADRFNWNTPVVFDPADPSIMYYGTNRLYRSTNHAASWTAISGDLTDGQGSGNLVYHTITTIAVSSLNPELIYTGSDDGNIYVTENGSVFHKISTDLPKRWVTRVVADPIDQGVVYVTLSGYRWNEYQPHVFISMDYGVNWTDISSNLPEAPVNDLIVSAGDNTILFAATDMGVYVTYNQGGHWEPLGNNLPHVVVTDLAYHQPTNKMVAATFGRSMYSYNLEQDPQTAVGEKISDDITLNVYPNPFHERTNILVGGMSPPGNALIYNLSGQLVSVLPFVSHDPIIWDGTNQNGKRVKKGIYFCRIQSGNQLMAKKIILQ